MDKSAMLPCNFALMRNWDDVRYAILVARYGSIAEAARQLGVNQTTVSRRIKILEASFGTPLFERMRGHLAPTPIGNELLARGQRMESEMAALCHLVTDKQAHVQGVVRITALDALTSHYLAHQLPDLKDRHPGLDIEIITSNKSLDLGRREADIAVRLARPTNGDFVIKCLGRLTYGIYGPEKPWLYPSWKTAPWVAYERSLEPVPEMCWLSENIGQQNVAFRCNNLDALATAVVNGIGLAILPRLVAKFHNRLRCLSGPEPVLSREMWLIVPRELRDAPRIRATSDWLTERFSRDNAIFS